MTSSPRLRRAWLNDFVKVADVKAPLILAVFHIRLLTKWASFSLLIQYSNSQAAYSALCTQTYKSIFVCLVSAQNALTLKKSECENKSSKLQYLLCSQKKLFQHVACLCGTPTHCSSFAWFTTAAVSFLNQLRRGLVTSWIIFTVWIRCHGSALSGALAVLCQNGVWFKSYCRWFAWSNCYCMAILSFLQQPK